MIRYRSLQYIFRQNFRPLSYFLKPNDPIKDDPIVKGLKTPRIRFEKDIMRIPLPPRTIPDDLITWQISAYGSLSKMEKYYTHFTGHPTTLKVHLQVSDF